LERLLPKIKPYRCSECQHRFFSPAFFKEKEK
jgi:hypothetical protein